MTEAADAGEAPVLSAFLIVLNEEARLPRTLAALQGLADEVVVVDAGSTDRSREIAAEAGARVLHREFDGYGQQKRFAEDACRGRWLLNVDADEVVPPALADEIRAVVAEDAPVACRIPINDVYPGETAPRPMANDYCVVRLYRRDVGRYRDHPVYDRVETSGEIRTLRSAIHHFSFLDWSAIAAKGDRISSFQAATAKPRPVWTLKLRLFTEFPLTLLRMLVLRRHLFGGWKGWALSVSVAFARFLRIVKMLEKQEKDGG